jgi:hypothetical protein
MARRSFLVAFLAFGSGCVLVGPTPAEVAGVRKIAACPSAEVSQIETAKPMYRATGCGKTVDTFCNGGGATATCFPLPMSIEDYVRWYADSYMKGRKCKDYTLKKLLYGRQDEFWEASGCGAIDRHQCKDDTGFPQCHQTTLAESPPASAQPAGPKPAPAKPKVTPVKK